MPEGVREEDAELVDHLDHPEDEKLGQVVALLEVYAHGREGDVQDEEVGDNEHDRGLDVKK